MYQISEWKMSLSLKETQVIAELAEFFYPFLPGQAHPFADESISFAGTARDMGLGHFWRGGSKRPAISGLLENTLHQRNDKFCLLVLEIVRRGMQYRSSKGNSITKEEIQTLNDLILELGFKIPELWDERFLLSLPRETPEQHVDTTEVTPERLEELRDALLSIEKLPSHRKGFEFERFLNELFDTFGLEPRAPFRLRGEQIDGSIELENHTYLVEAKFQSNPVGQEDLLTFRSKVEGKATWSRGIFVSISHFTENGLAAFSRGRPTNLIAFNGQDLFFIVDGKMPLDQAIKLKARRAAETGEVMVSVQQLLLEH